MACLPNLVEWPGCGFIESFSVKPELGCRFSNVVVVYNGGRCRQNRIFGEGQCACKTSNEWPKLSKVFPCLPSVVYGVRHDDGLRRL